MLDAALSTRRSRAIDLLRGLLALWVVLVHLIPWSHVAQGEHATPQLVTDIFNWTMRIFQKCYETHPAVLAFIVLSGYCIHRGGWRRDSGETTTFVIRRGFRIGPVDVLATLLGVACFWYYEPFNPTVARALTATSDITWWGLIAKLVGINVFYPVMNLSLTYLGNSPLLTVSVEIWLYALYPLLIVLARRWGERALWALVGAGWLGGLILTMTHPALTSWWHNGSLLSFLLFWWIGAKCVEPAFASRLWSWRLPLVAVWFGLTVVLMAGWTTLLPVVEARKILFALLTGLVVARCDNWEVPSLRWFEPLGTAAYSIYAFHTPIVITLLFLGVAWWAIVLAVVAVGIATYHCVELPFIQLGRRLAQKAPPAPVSLVPPLSRAA